MSTSTSAFRPLFDGELHQNPCPELVVKLEQAYELAERANLSGTVEHIGRLAKLVAVPKFGLVLVNQGGEEIRGTLDRFLSWVISDLHALEPIGGHAGDSGKRATTEIVLKRQLEGVVLTLKHFLWRLRAMKDLALHRQIVEAAKTFLMEMARKVLKMICGGLVKLAYQVINADIIFSVDTWFQNLEETFCMETHKMEKETANDRVRLQVDMTRERLDSIDKLVTIAGMTSRKELLDNALTLIAWAIRETRSGNVIASMNLKKDSYKEVAMPCLEHVSQHDFSTNT